MSARRATWRPLGLLLLIAGLFCVFGGDAAAQSEPSALFAGGDELCERWLIERVEPHAEYVRVYVAGSAGKTGLEIVYNNGREAAYKTAHSIVQPAPNTEPPRALLACVRDFLAAHPTADRALDLAPKREERELAKPLERQRIWPLLLLAFVLLAGAFVWPIWLSRRFPERRAAIAVIFLVLSAFTASYMALVSTESIPIGITNAYQDGPSPVATMYGQGVHGWGSYHRLMSWLAPEGADAFLDRVRINLWLGVLNAGLMLLMLLLIVKTWVPALLFTAALVLTPVYVHTMTSPYFSQLSYLFMLMLLPPLLFVWENRGHWRRSLAAFAYLAAPALVLAGLRTELALLGLGAIVSAFSALLITLFGNARYIRVLVVAFVAGFAGMLIWTAVGEPEQIAQIANNYFHGYAYQFQHYSLDKPTLRLMPRLLSLMYPPGLLVLGLLGFAVALRRPFRFAFLPLSLLVLLEIFGAFAPGVAGTYTLTRYLAQLAPALLFLAGLGFAALGSILARANVSRLATRLAPAFLAALAALVPPLGFGSEYAEVYAHELARYRLDYNQQLQVRDMLESLREHPQCVFLTHFRRDESGTFLQVYGRPLAEPLVLPYSREEEARLRRRLSQVSPCLLDYQSVSCNMEELQGVCNIIGCRTLGRLNFPSRAIYPARLPERVDIGTYRCPAQTESTTPDKNRLR